MKKAEKSNCNNNNKKNITVINKGKELKELKKEYSCCKKTQRMTEMYQ